MCALGAVVGSSLPSEWVLGTASTGDYFLRSPSCAAAVDFLAGHEGVVKPTHRRQLAALLGHVCLVLVQHADVVPGVTGRLWRHAQETNAALQAELDFHIQRRSKGIIDSGEPSAAVPPSPTAAVASTLPSAAVPPSPTAAVASTLPSAAAPPSPTAAVASTLPSAAAPPSPTAAVASTLPSAAAPPSPTAAVASTLPSAIKRRDATRPRAGSAVKHMAG
jgi:hypothetical protein